MQVLQAVAEAANEQGNCYPSLAQFAAAARMSRSNAWRTLKHLRQERWIVTNRILGRGGVLILQINLQKLAGCTRLESQRSAVAVPAKRQIRQTRSIRRPESRLNLLTRVRLL